MANVSKLERIRRQWRIATDASADVVERQIALYALAQAGEIPKTGASSYSRALEVDARARPPFVPQSLHMDLSDMDELDRQISAKQQEIDRMATKSTAAAVDPLGEILARLANMDARLNALTGAPATAPATAPASAPATAPASEPKPATPKTIVLQPIDGASRDGRIRYQLRSGAGQLFAIVYWPLNEVPPQSISVTLTPNR